MKATVKPVDAAEFGGLMAQFLPKISKNGVAVGVSGGSDSLALLLLAQAWARRRRLPIVALTVDHRLRPNSTAEAETVAGWCASRAIAHKTLTWRGNKPDTGIQAAARDARYRLMGQWCRRHGVTALLVAHQVEDQAETVLMRLCHGSGVDGLAAMAPAVRRDGFWLMRPLLAVTRGRLVATLRAVDQPWLDDPSNLDQRFERVRIRRTLADLNVDGVASGRIARTAGRMARAGAALDQATADLRGAIYRDWPAGYATLDGPALAAAPEEIALRLLGHATEEIGGGGRPNLARLERLYEALRPCLLGRREQRLVRTLNRCEIRLANRQVMLCRERRNLQPALGLAGTRTVSWDRRFRFRVNLRRGAAMPPDLTIGALEPAGWQEIHHKLTGYLKKMPPLPVTATLPALRHLDAIVACPHLEFIDPAAANWLKSVTVERTAPERHDFASS